MSVGVFVGRRLVAGLPVVLGVTLVTFLLFRAFGGDPVARFLGKSASAGELAAYARAYGYDQPLWEQYLRYLGRLATLDLGRSFVSRRPVLELIAEGAGPSLCLTLPSLLLGNAAALALASFAARRRGRASDRGVVVVTVLATSVSALAYIGLGQWLLAYRWGWFPIHGFEPGLVERWRYLALPIAILVLLGLGHDTLLYRALLLEALGKEHVTAARARGLPMGRVLLRHVLPSAAGPIMARLAAALPTLVLGSLLLESFFGIPGLGTMLLDALDQADAPVLEAWVALVSILNVAANAAADLVVALVDPRVRLASPGLGPEDRPR